MGKFTTGNGAIDWLIILLLVTFAIRVLFDVVGTIIFVQRSRARARERNMRLGAGAGQMFFYYWIYPKGRKARQTFNALEREYARRVMQGIKRANEKDNGRHV